MKSKQLFHFDRIFSIFNYQLKASIL